MATLREYLNAKIKSKGSTLAKEKAKAKKYKSISAAKKAGALYYTNKAGKIMAAVFAEDLKKPISKLAPKKSARPKARLTEAEKRDKILAETEADFVKKRNEEMRAEEKAAYDRKLQEAMDALNITNKTRIKQGFDPSNLAGPSEEVKELAAKKLAAKRAREKKENGLNRGGMAKKNVMSYNLGGMVKSQVNNLKRGK
mgnify:FL=1